MAGIEIRDKRGLLPDMSFTDDGDLSIDVFLLDILFVVIDTSGSELVADVRESGGGDGHGDRGGPIETTD